MAHFGATFDATTVEPNKPIEILPPGKYVVQIVASEMRATKDGQGQYLWLELDVLEGEFQGRKLFDRLNLVNNNPTTVEIAQRTLSAICHATGRMQVQDSEELHLAPMVADVRVQPSKTEGYGPANTLRYLPLERPGQQQPSPASRAGEVGGAVASTGSRPSTPAPAARPTGPTPPWRKNA